MKTIIIYATHHGTTAKVAEMIAVKLGQSQIDVITVQKAKKIDIDRYDTIILGSSVHAGRNQEEMRRFCKDKLELLLKKRIGLYLCSLAVKEYEQNKRISYPALLQDHALAYEIMGGEYLFDKMNFLEKMILKKVAGVTEPQSLIDEEAIERFSKKMFQ